MDLLRHKPKSSHSKHIDLFLFGSILFQRFRKSTITRHYLDGTYIKESRGIRFKANYLRCIEYTKHGKRRNEIYYLNGELHRENGPARVYYFWDESERFEEYFKHGKLHRDGGPAIVNFNSEGIVTKEEYYCCNYQVSKSFAMNS